jgi:hypothetical protein
MKKVHIYAKHNDLAALEVYDGDKKIFEKDGYLPSEFLSITNGDELDFVIDIETGRILNWDKEKFIKIFQEEDETEEEIKDFGISNLDEKNRIYNEERLKASKEDEIYYKEKFNEYNKLIKNYKDKFSAKLDSEGTLIYNSNNNYEYDCAFFIYYRIFKTTILLFENNINCEFKMGGIYVDDKESDKARNILRNNGAYTNEYCRRKDDSYFIEFDYS